MFPLYLCGKAYITFLQTRFIFAFFYLYGNNQNNWLVLDIYCVIF